MSRNAMLAKIHIGKKTLGWSDEEYRDILQLRYSKASAGKLTFTELADMCDHFRKQGVDFKPKDKAKERARFYEIPAGTPYADQKRYIAALWNKLGYHMAGLDTRVKKQFRVDKFIWLNDQNHLQTLAKDLHNRCHKAGLDPDPIA